ncbi:MAG TPA: hypothetical protein VD884_06080 [Ohtaekwangia sp.]|nr:hypothetical protein [Ohtaekwangia sp.]
MLSFLRKAALPFLFIVCLFKAHGQTFSTARDGDWTDPSTWEGGVVPEGGATEIIEIYHEIYLPEFAEVTIYQVTIQGELYIASNATLSLLDGSQNNDLLVLGSLEVAGTFIQEDGAVLGGTYALNTRFLSGSLYRYRWTSAGILPVINWDSQATLLVERFNTNVSLTSDSWNQHFGNFIYDCPAQGSFMDFNGRLTNVQGDLIIRNTNGNILRFARSHAMNLSIGGDFIIEGRSEVWLGESSNNLNVSVWGDFIFRSTSTASSYLTLNGQTTMEVYGNVIIDTSYKLKFTSASGEGDAVLAVSGNFSFLQGTIDAMGDGKATIVFEGENLQVYTRSEGTVSKGNFDFEIAADAEVDLGTSLLSNTLSGSVVVYGKLNVGSPNALGALQGGPEGNIDVVGSVVFSDGAVLEYNGSSGQYIGYHPSGEPMTTVINNDAGVTLLQNTAIGSLHIESGTLNCSVHTVSVAKHISVHEGASLISEGTIQCTTDGLQEIDVNGSTLHNVLIQGSNKVVDLLSAMQVTGLISFGGTGSTFNTQNFLTLISSSVNGEGNGHVGSLVNGNRITGNVTVQRYMDPGRVYRYLSSPVKNATVNFLQDDFPITGPFDDASTGPGITTGNPSLFYYDESFRQGWINYPSSGSATEYTLVPGTGYAAFIRERNLPVTWDVTGEINQGEVSLPVTYTSGQDEMDGWNLVGNPYPSAIAWNSIGWIKNQISSGIAVRDNVHGRVRVWDGSIGDLPNGYIAPGQAFWVRTVGEEPQLVIGEQAKHAGDGVPFYRGDDEVVDYLEITVRNNDVYDKAYLRLRPASRTDIDEHDIPKLQNDLLNIALLTPAGKPLSLYAVESIPCTFDIPLSLASDGTEALRIDLKQYGKFLHGDVSLINKTTGNALQPNEAGVYAIDTNVDTEWMLRIVSAPASEIQYRLPETICAEHKINITLTEVEDEKEYLLYRRRDGFTMSLTDRSKGIFTLPPSTVFDSDYTIFSTSACAVDSVHFTLSEQRPKSPQADDQAHCGEGKITLSARGAAFHQTYVWFTHDMGTLLGENQKFTTPYLNETESYAVCIRDTLTGCLSPAVNVNVQIEEPTLLTIRYENNKLRVSSPPPNEWYFEGIRLPDSTEYLVPTLDGLYSVRKQTGSCTSETGYNYQKLSKNAVLVYPNPANEYTRYAMKNRDVILNDIITINGVSVFYLCKLDCSESECRLDISALKSGTYFLIYNIKGTVARTSLSVY